MEKLPVTLEEVLVWYESGEKGPDPRGLRPSPIHIYDFKKQKWNRPNIGMSF